MAISLNDYREGQESPLYAEIKSWDWDLIVRAAQANRSPELLGSVIDLAPEGTPPHGHSPIDTRWRYALDAVAHSYGGTISTDGDLLFFNLPVETE